MDVYFGIGEGEPRIYAQKNNFRRFAFRSKSGTRGRTWLGRHSEGTELPPFGGFWKESVSFNICKSI